MSPIACSKPRSRAAPVRPAARPALSSRARARDWIVLDPDHPDLAEQTSATWLSSAVFCEHGETPVRDVFVGGERVIHARRHRDEARHYADYRRALAQLLADA